MDKIECPPVLFIIFNRPKETSLVFDAIRAARPQKLFIAADGPRLGNQTDAELCTATRKIIGRIDWPCEVKTRFNSENLGCRKGVSSAISWFFENIDEGIILEDDCLPNESFFPYCAELLTKYRTNEKVMMISGSNYQEGVSRSEGSYYFSKLASIWGWATWKRAWHLFDSEMKGYREFRHKNGLRDVWDDPVFLEFYYQKLDSSSAGGNSWAFPWTYALFANQGLCICPNENLISNIGFGGGTHIESTASAFSKAATIQLRELRHPSSLSPSREADLFLTRKASAEQLEKTGSVRRLVNKLKMFIFSSFS